MGGRTSICGQLMRQGMGKDNTTTETRKPITKSFSRLGSYDNTPNNWAEIHEVGDFYALVVVPRTISISNI